MKKMIVFCAVLIFLSGLGQSTAAEPEKIPPFKVCWIFGATYGILINQKLTDKDIEGIIYQWQEVRKKDAFHTLLPRNRTRLKNPYSMLGIEIFTDPAWCKKEHNDRYFNERMSKKMEMTYINKIRGYYGWQENVGLEMGTIGTKDGKLKSKNYRMLFHRQDRPL